MNEPSLLIDKPCVLGEGPIWHPDDQSLYWLDISAGQLFRYQPGNGECETFDLGQPTGGFTLQQDGKLLLFMSEGTVTIWRDGTMETVIREIPEERGNRFNDVIADPAGRVYAGTMSTDKKAGCLYRIDPDGTKACLLTGLGTSNGMGFTDDNKTFYHTDTRQHAIFAFDYDQTTGTITNRRKFIHVTDNDGRPDGMTIDSEGCIWSARYDGGCVVRYDPDGVMMQKYRVPAPKVTSLTFGGSDLTDIFITTAGGNERATDGPLAGALFHMNLGIPGRQEYRSSIRTPENRTPTKN